MIITIARCYGSGGKEIGRLLAKTLGINYYGREIIEMASGDNKNKDSIHEIYSCDESFNASFEEEDEKFRRQSEVICRIAERESCVFVGRGADYVLRDKDDVHKIYLYAPLRACMRRIIRLYELNPDDAKSLIHSMNKTRGDYYHHNTGQVWSDPTHYDLCLNTAGLEHEQCVKIISDYLDTRRGSHEA